MKSFARTALYLTSLVTLFLYSCGQENRGRADGHSEKLPGAYYAMEHWAAQRDYQDGGFAERSGTYFEAWEKSRLVQAMERRSDDPEPWETVGPWNTAGRMLTVVFNPQNPNTVWAGSASGGIWRSYSGGDGYNAWHRVETGFPVLGVMSIDFAALDSNVIYAGTGEVYNPSGVGNGGADRALRGTYGIGIIKSVDGGQTWTKSLDWSYDENRGVNQVRVDPHDDNRVWAATTEGLFLSTDAGSTWQAKLGMTQVVDVWVNVGDPNNVIATVGNLGSSGHGIYRSVDGGDNWSQVTSGVPSSFNGKALISGGEGDPDVIYISIGNGFSSSDGFTWLVKSTDAGATWSTVNTVDYSRWQGWFSHDVLVHPDDEDEVVCIGIDVWRSTDGGNTLVQESTSGLTLGTPGIGVPDGSAEYIHSDLHDLAWHPTDPDVLYIAGDGGIFRSEDRGQTFASINGGLQTTQFYPGTSTTAADTLFFMGGLQDNSTVIWRGTEAWSRNVGGDGSWGDAHPTNPNVLYTSYQFLNPARTVNGGINWDFLAVPGGGWTSFIAPLQLCNDDPTVMYGGRDVVYKSLDGGDSWFAPTPFTLDGNPALSLTIWDQDCDVVYATTAAYFSRSGAHVTEDGGSSWTDITAALPDRYLNDIAIDPIDPAVAYVAVGGWGSSHVFKTADFGNTWTDLDAGQLPDVPAQAIIVDPEISDHIYVGNDLGVWLSRDGGLTWEDWNQGLAEAQIAMDLAISPTDRKLFVATHGNGAYRRALFEPEDTVASGVSDVTAGIGLTCWPNPVEEHITVEALLSPGEQGILSIADLQGRVLIRTRLPESSSGVVRERLEISALPAGQYSLTVRSGSAQETRMVQKR